MSDMHRLPVTGNFLVVDSVCVPEHIRDLTLDMFDGRMHANQTVTGTRIREYAAQGHNDVVFEIRVGDPVGRLVWQVYGGLKVPSLYPPQLRTDAP